MNSSHLRPSWFLLVGVATILTGCQSYQSKPLHLEAHDAQWRMRAIEPDPVRAFASRLAQSESSDVFDPSDGITRSEAELIALVYNPGLRRARLQAGLAKSTAEHAGLWEDPQFSMDLLSVTQVVSDSYTVSPGLAFTIPVSGRLGAEKDRAESALDAELARVREQEWDTRVQVRNAWVEWSTSVLKASAIRVLIESIDQLMESTTRLEAAGEVQKIESSLFAIERAQLQHALNEYEGLALIGEQKLLSVLGLSPDSSIDLLPSIGLEPTENNSIDILVKQNPTLARLREEYEITERALYLEIRKQYPDLSIGPLADFENDDSKIGFGFSFPIPLLNMNKQGIAQAHAQREISRAAYETKYEELVGELNIGISTYELHENQRALLKDDLVPLTDQQLEDARKLIGLGESNTLILLESLSRVGDAQMLLVETRADLAQSIIRVNQLIGPPAFENTHNQSSSTRNDRDQHNEVSK